MFFQQSELIQKVMMVRLELYSVKLSRESPRLVSAQLIPNHLVPWEARDLSRGPRQVSAMLGLNPCFSQAAYDVSTPAQCLTLEIKGLTEELGAWGPREREASIPHILSVLKPSRTPLLKQTLYPLLTFPQQDCLPLPNTFCDDARR